MTHTTTEDAEIAAILTAEFGPFYPAVMAHLADGPRLNITKLSRETGRSFIDCQRLATRLAHRLVQLNGHDPD